MVEATGNNWIRLYYDTLTEHGVWTLLADPLKIRMIAEARRIKTDRVDCAPRNLYDSWM
jgi:transposase